MNTPAFVVRLLDRVTIALRSRRLHVLHDDDKRALLSLFYGIALADGTLALAEQQALEQLGRTLGVNWTVVDDVGVGAAVKRLARDEALLRFACTVVADAVFVDGRYDDAEQRFVASFAEKFALPHNTLRDAVEALRAHKLDDALRAWDDAIVHGEPLSTT